MGDVQAQEYPYCSGRCLVWSTSASVVLKRIFKAVAQKERGAFNPGTAATHLLALLPFTGSSSAREGREVGRKAGQQAGRRAGRAAHHRTLPCSVSASTAFCRKKNTPALSTSFSLSLYQSNQKLKRSEKKALKGAAGSSVFAFALS